MYRSKGMSKKLGCALYIRCALSIEKYGTLKSLTFLSDIPIYTAIGSIMSVIIYMVNVRRKYVEAKAARRERER
jgi:hypothetical protein